MVTRLKIIRVEGRLEMKAEKQFGLQLGLKFLLDLQMEKLRRQLAIPIWGLEERSKEEININLRVFHIQLEKFRSCNVF